MTIPMKISLFFLIAFLMFSLGFGLGRLTYQLNNPQSRQQMQNTENTCSVGLS